MFFFIIYKIQFKPSINTGLWQFWVLYHHPRSTWVYSSRFLAHGIWTEYHHTRHAVWCKYCNLTDLSGGATISGENLA